MSVFADKEILVMSLHQNGNENSKMFTLNSPEYGTQSIIKAYLIFVTDAGDILHVETF